MGSVSSISEQVSSVLGGACGRFRADGSEVHRDADSLCVEGVGRDIDDVLDLLLGKRRPSVREFISAESWDSGGGFTDTYVIGIDGLLFTVFHSLPEFCDDNSDGTLTVHYTPVDVDVMPSAMTDKVRRCALDSYRKGAAKVAVYAPDHLVCLLREKAGDLLPSELSGVDVGLFLSALQSHIEAASVAQQTEHYRGAAVKSGIPKAKARRVARHERKLAAEAARLEIARQAADTVDAALTRLPSSF